MENYRPNKKGFTLIELVVVMTIIAILAAVAVPTTLHFIEKAHESNDQSLIDISENVGNYINLSTINNSGNFILDDNISSFISMIESDVGTVESRKYIKSIKLSFEEDDNTSYGVYCEIIGKKESKNDQTVKRLVITGIDASKLFSGLNVDQIPTSITFNILDGAVDSYNIV